MTLTENQRLCLMAIEGRPRQIREILAIRRKQTQASRDSVCHCVTRMAEEGLVRTAKASNRGLLYSLSEFGLSMLEDAGRHAPVVIEPPKQKFVGQRVPSRTYVNSCTSESYVPPVWQARDVGNREIASHGVRC
jgi:hypothetical protein